MRTDSMGDRLMDGLLRVEWRAAQVPAQASRLRKVPLFPVADDRDGPPARAQSAAVVAALDAASALGFVQDWLADRRLAGTHLVVTTRDAVAVTGADRVTGLAQAPIWGLVRSIRAERPDRGFTLLDLDAYTEASDVLGAALATGEPELAARNGELLLPRLVRRPSASPRPARDPAGTVLITGGAGSVAALVAPHLVRTHGVRHVLLLDCHRPDETLVAELTGLGAEVTVAAVDVADRAALAEVLAAVPPEHPLTGVVHAAGVADDGGPLARLDAERLERVMAPVAQGARNLDELAGDVPLFVLFSSASGLIGWAGQASAAAAAAYVDALAQRRRAAGRAAHAVAWGLWVEAGSTTRLLGAAEDGLVGVVPMSAEYSLALLDAALGTDDALLIAARLDVGTTRARPRRASRVSFRARLSGHS